MAVGGLWQALGGFLFTVGGLWQAPGGADTEPCGQPTTSQATARMFGGRGLCA